MYAVPTYFEAGFLPYFLAPVKKQHHNTTTEQQYFDTSARQPSEEEYFYPANYKLIFVILRFTKFYNINTCKCVKRSLFWTFCMQLSKNTQDKKQSGWNTAHWRTPYVFIAFFNVLCMTFNCAKLEKILDSRSIHLKRITLSFWLSEGGDRWERNQKAPSRYILKVTWGVSQHKRLTKLYYLRRRGVD